MRYCASLSWEQSTDQLQRRVTTSIPPAGAVINEHLNWGYIQLGLVALVFGALQLWWISSVFWRRDLARPQSGREFRKSLERIWKK